MSNTSLTYAVTGASRGLGLEFVKQLAERGNTVFALLRNPGSAEALKSLVDNKKVFAIQLDANDENSIKAAADEIARLAPEGIDVLINNAGVGNIGAIDRATSADFRHVFETNVIGANNTIRILLPLLKQRGQDKVKKILNISSALGSIELTNREFGEKRPPVEMAAYDASKAALNMVVKLWAGHLAQENFVVYSSHPGWVKTDMGSRNAPVEVTDSISGQLAVLDRLTVADNGTFYDFEGRKLPW